MEQSKKESLPLEITAVDVEENNDPKDTIFLAWVSFQINNSLILNGFKLLNFKDKIQLSYYACGHREGNFVSVVETDDALSKKLKEKALEAYLEIVSRRICNEF